MALVIGISSAPAGAWVYVGNVGYTSGWQQLTYIAGPSGFSGTAGFLVANYYDEFNYSTLLLDGLSQGGASGNSGFELVNYNGYTLGTNSNGQVVSSIYSPDPSWPAFSAKEGTHFSQQNSYNTTPLPATFLNAYGNPGYNGSTLETPISLGSNASFSFWWAFLTTDYDPYQDFSLFYLKDGDGTIVYTEGLGQLTGTGVPLPSTLLLLGSGLLGLAPLSRLRRTRR